MAKEVGEIIGSDITANELFERFLSQKRLTLDQDTFTAFFEHHSHMEKEIVRLAGALDTPMRSSLIDWLGHDNFDETKFRFYLNSKARREVQEKPNNYNFISDKLWEHYIQPGYLEPRTNLWSRAALVEFIPFISQRFTTATWILCDADRLKRGNDVDQQVGHLIIQILLNGFDYYSHTYHHSFGFVPNIGGGDEGISYIPGAKPFEAAHLTQDINEVIAAEVPSIASLVGKTTIFNKPLMIHRNKEMLTPTAEEMDRWMARAAALNDDEVLTTPPTLTAGSGIVTFEPNEEPVVQCFKVFTQVNQIIGDLKRARNIRRTLG